jgi:hypothetical protein
MESNSHNVADIIDFLNRAGVAYVDKRKKGGNLWLIGGKELSDVAEQARTLGHTFTFRADGGQATHHKPGWWAK